MRRTKVGSQSQKCLINFLKLRHEVNEVKLDISSRRDGNKGKSTLEVSNGYVRQNLQQFFREEGIGMDGLIEYFGINKRVCVAKFGKKEQGTRVKWHKRVKIG